LIDQQRIARIAGIALLVICASALLSNNLIVAGDALATASNLRTHERWFRVGVLGEFIMLNGDIVLAIALYFLLSPVQRPLALLGSIWRLANAGLLCVGLVASLMALSHATSPAPAEVSEALQASFMRMWLHAQGTAESLGLILFGLGAATHSYLLYRSRYIPRILSGAYLLVTALLGIFCLGMIVFPELEGIVIPWILAPDFLVELLVALWLTFRGVSVAAASKDFS
jgi:hypothetical protein